MRSFLFIINILFILTFTACGGGDSSSSSSNNNSDFSSKNTITGTFIDSPVEGLNYTCSSRTSGTTNSKGQYICQEGDLVTFSIGDITLGTIEAQEDFITPYSLFPGDNNAAINLARLLQTLDTDGNPDNDIILNTDLINKLPKDFSFSSATFEVDAERFLGKKLRSKEKALDHLHASISNAEGNTTKFDNSQKNFLYNLFTTEYFWFDKVSNSVNYLDYTTPDEMINGLKYSTLDKWSHYSTLEDYENSSKQATTGFGCMINNDNVVVYTRIDSPCDKAGIKRGDRINYYDSNAQIMSITRNNQAMSIPIQYAAYNYKVTKSQIINQNGKKIGHMIYNSFTSASIDEIEKTFDEFNKENIDELIIDLRYNGGGSLATASILLDKIAGYGRENALQAKINWNNNYQSNNHEYTFFEDTNSLKNIKRVFFLTTEDTASASEMLINSLKPYVDVVVIGENTTSGKPVGMQGKKYQGLIYWLINFELVNANGEGGYFNGITSTCKIEDNLNYERTDINENMIAKVLYYLTNNRCYEKVTNGTYYNTKEEKTKYYNLTMDKDGKVEFKLNNYHDGVIIYDNNWNEIQKLSNSQIVSLKTGNYIIKVFKNGTYDSKISIFSPSFNTSKLTNLSNGTFSITKNNLGTYYKLDLKTSTLVDFGLNSFRDLTIYDINMNKIQELNYSKSIHLNKGTYFINTRNTYDNATLKVFSTAFDTINTSNLRNDTYTIKGGDFTYNKLNILNRSNIDFNIDFGSKVTIYDSTMKEINIIDSSKNISLDTGLYFVKFKNSSMSDSNITVFSTIFDTTNIPNLSNQKYDIGVKYYKLTLQNNQDISFYLNMGGKEVTIYDTNMTLLQNITSTKTISLNPGSYFVKLNNRAPTTHIVVFSSAFSTNTYENLINKVYAHEGTEYYNFSLSKNEKIQFYLNKYHNNSEITIYDNSMNQLHKINSSSTISLNAGSYVIKIYNGNSDSTSVYSPALNNSTSNLNNIIYDNYHQANYYKLTMPNNGKIDFHLTNSKNEVVILDTSLNILHTINNSSTISLNSGSYVIRIYNEIYDSTTVYSPILNTSNISKLTNGIYHQYDRAEYYNLTMPNNGKIDFHLTNSKNEVLIFDSSLNKLHTINNSSTISLNKGSYTVKIFLDRYERTSIYSPQLNTSSIPDLKNGRYYKLGAYYYKLNMINNGNIDFHLTDSRSNFIIFDTSLNKLHTINSSSTISLNRGSYIVRVFGYYGNTAVSSSVLN